MRSSYNSTMNAYLYACRATRSNPTICFRHSSIRFRKAEGNKNNARDCGRLMRIREHQNNGSLRNTQRKLSLFVMATDEENDNDDGGGDGGRSLNDQQPEKKRGTIVGAVSLIVGTSIGSGILALPDKTSPAGFIPSAVAITLCWLVLVIEALLLVEINVHLMNRWEKDEKKQQYSNETEVVSLKTMAQETLGEWGGNLASVTYIFLAYASMVAYITKSGDVLSQLINVDNPTISGIIFTLALALLISLGGTDTTDRVNRWLTVSMIGILLLIEVMVLSFGGWSDSMTIANWREVPQTIPVIIFSLVYHDITPVICAYLGGDLLRIRISIWLGSLVPLLSLLIWDGIALNLSPNLDGIDPLNFLMRRWSDMFPIVDVFSLLAVGTSLIGTLLGFSQFFKEQLANYFHSLPSKTGKLKGEFMDDQVQIKQENGRSWLEGKTLAILATSMAVFPSMFISEITPDAFSVATDVAGGYCMTILYGVLPPAMAWAMQTTVAESNKAKVIQVNVDRTALCNVKPILIVAGLLSCGIVMEQVVLDLVLILQ
ncbi:uncharacterized protein A4U43_C04F32620 [Asparagus officinalis]|uniref:Tyrosine-specific transport protein n=1 Tax=Asparagus officinalis TaxID=4686 RepID=A0A5P1F711_ASPOF|nr:uncharacterized protein LOC109839466 isoform X2 [Asparagus officinalis]ONK73533.1 uncharacterized protein A4U43_C04F32620 [Asparagus officinalis]